MFGVWVILVLSRILLLVGVTAIWFVLLDTCGLVGFRMLVCLPVLVWLRFDFWGLCSMPFVVFLDLVAGRMYWFPSSVACV